MTSQGWSMLLVKRVVFVGAESAAASNAGITGQSGSVNWERLTRPFVLVRFRCY